MGNGNSNLWIGLGIGSVIGALAYRFSRTSRAKMLKEKVCDAFYKITDRAEDMWSVAKEKAADAGKAVADKVADKTSDIAGKADELRGKVHTLISEARKET